MQREQIAFQSSLLLAVPTPTKAGECALDSYRSSIQEIEVLRKSAQTYKPEGGARLRAEAITGFCECPVYEATFSRHTGIKS